MRYSIAHLWVRGLCNIFVEVIPILALRAPIFKPFSQIPTKNLELGILYDSERDTWNHRDVTDLQFGYILIRGSVCYVKKADFVGGFVFVHGGGDIAYCGISSG